VSAKTVNRRDITISEERDYEIGFYETGISEASVTRTTWTATLDGRLSTGEAVEISRHGLTFTEAREALEEVIAAEGWGIL